ncbi:PhoH family protein [Venenivibrio stagnispumantis]|uniref:PhoH-like protein n=1 Tax=Venenivibrio stagnispumantis TaxID=407998 RepID=A0AA46ADL5_9AQUI|nr:PhoH family protein [Venenivibrio stagnispumantis]MCW4573526.1 PhoH family protein [Venenivibrio stagnispumantis]SMP06138.1 phosphate starvation-inducible protein PhoH [Venenivibrio stagnispumantis]
MLNILKLEIEIPVEAFFNVVGSKDENLKYFSEIFNLDIFARGTSIIASGEEKNLERFEEFMQKISSYFEVGHVLSPQDVRNLAVGFKVEKEEKYPETGDVILFSYRKKPIMAKTPTQKLYVQTIKENDITFGVGPAGTGKTYLAMAVAVAYLKQQKVNRIILTRPAVEAGEKLGFLPGSLEEKVDPYLRPLYDALYDMVDPDKVVSMIEKKVVEVAPLAFMRGRTLNDAFIILDEAQNTTKEQMKMLLTRIGFGSKVVITGDITQIDLPKTAESGLIEAIKVLQNVKGIGFVQFSDKDVVRHPIVQRIIQAYDRYEQTKAGKNE